MSTERVRDDREVLSRAGLSDVGVQGSLADLVATVAQPGTRDLIPGGGSVEVVLPAETEFAAGIDEQVLDG